MFQSYIISCIDQSGEADTGDEENTTMAVFIVSNEIRHRNDRTASIVFIKRGAVIEADKNIAEQIQVTQ